jgi:(p)ppGpp synthase/HD superfamily hydrolase
MYLLGAAAILHDVVEDCYQNMTRDEKMAMIAKEFGYAVASLVDELTLDKSQYSQIGKTQYLCNEVMKMSSYALAIKLCDRLDNVMDLKDMDKEFSERYKKETRDILQALSKRPLTETHKKLVKLIKKEI